jgi:hypothetical protein
MFVPSLRDKISELLAKQIGFAADAILRQYALGNLTSLDDAYDAIWYVSTVIQIALPAKRICLSPFYQVALHTLALSIVSDYEKL